MSQMFGMLKTGCCQKGGMSLNPFGAMEKHPGMVDLCMPWKKPWNAQMDGFVKEFPFPFESMFICGISGSYLPFSQEFSCSIVGILTKLAAKHFHW